MDKEREDFENMAEAKPLTEELYLKFRNLEKEMQVYDKKWKIFDVFETKIENPSLSLRELAKKTKLSKDTVSNYLKKGKKIYEELLEWSIKNNQDPGDKLIFYEPEGLAVLREISKCFGVLDKNF